MRIAVIGAGVIGTTVAARLAEGGADVVLIDKGAPGTGTTSTSYGWVNANGKQPRAYFDLNVAGLAAHARLSPEGPGGWLVRGGHVEFAVDDHHHAALSARSARLRDWGYRAEEISADAARALLPDIRLPDGVRLIVYYPDETHAFPAMYLAHMLAAARTAGARLRTGIAVVSLAAADGGTAVGLADGSVETVDRVVSATGRWTTAVAALAGARVPVRAFAEPGDIVVGYLAVTDPLPVRLERLVTSPRLNVRPAGGGRLMLQALDLDATADPRAVPGPDGAVAREMLSRLRGVLRNTDGARISEIMVGQRAMPEDGRTIAGFAPGIPWLYVVATHSGITLAPYLGNAVATEVLGTPQKELEPFRIERFGVDRTFGRPDTPREPGEQ
jgi:glycine/D-amino acid oxidase-like deaminating enzyme